MKITSFQPMIAVPAESAEDTIAIFEALGFACQHHKDYGSGMRNYTMKSEEGFKVDLTILPVAPKNHMTIRMNVSNMDEAVELLQSKGLTLAGNVQSDATAKGCMMAAPSGFTIMVAEHIK